MAGRSRPRSSPDFTAASSIPPAIVVAQPVSSLTDSRGPREAGTRRSAGRDPGESEPCLHHTPSPLSASLTPPLPSPCLQYKANETEAATRKKVSKNLNPWQFRLELQGFEFRILRGCAHGNNEAGCARGARSGA
uniref:Uncharacterized protein n=1 Tax=Aegilops tauschii subsp. strangulata TaxID=200361 RepID=A0A453B6L5_AEGTS